MEDVPQTEMQDPASNALASVSGGLFERAALSFALAFLASSAAAALTAVIIFEVLDLLRGLLTDPSYSAVLHMDAYYLPVMFMGVVIVFVFGAIFGAIPFWLCRYICLRFGCSRKFASFISGMLVSFALWFYCRKLTAQMPPLGFLTSAEPSQYDFMWSWLEGFAPLFAGFVSGPTFERTRQALARRLGCV